MNFALISGLLVVAAKKGKFPIRDFHEKDRIYKHVHVVRFL